MLELELSLLDMVCIHAWYEYMHGKQLATVIIIRDNITYKENVLSSDTYVRSASPSTLQVP